MSSGAAGWLHLKGLHDTGATAGSSGEPPEGHCRGLKDSAGTLMRCKSPPWPDMAKDSQQISWSARALQAAPWWGATETCSQVWRPCPAHHWQPAARPWGPWGRHPSCYSTLAPALQGCIYMICYSHSAWDTLPKPTAVRQGNAPTSALPCASVHTDFTKRAPLRPKHQTGWHAQPPREQTLVCANTGPAGCFHLCYQTCTETHILARAYPTEEQLIQWHWQAAAAGHCAPTPARTEPGCSVAQAGLSPRLAGGGPAGWRGHDTWGGSARPSHGHGMLPARRACAPCNGARFSLPYSAITNPHRQRCSFLCSHFQLCHRSFFLHANGVGGSFVKKWVCSTVHFYCKFPIIYVGFSPKISYTPFFGNFDK